MKRFSVLAFRQKSGKSADLAFLQTMETPLNKTIAPRAAPQPSATAPGRPKLTVTSAMGALQSAVLHRKYDQAERLFAEVPRLIERPAALRLLIKIYCEQFDFVSARALLFRGASTAGLTQIGDAGVARFVAHVTYSARNAQLIDETFQRAAELHAERGTAPDPRLVTTVLNGLLFLGEHELFAVNWAELPRKTQKRALESQVLRLLLIQDWDEASALWREIAANGVVASGRSVWYMALRYYLTEARDASAVARVLSAMRDMDIALTPDFSALLIRHLDQAQLDAFAPGAGASPMTAVEWLQFARDQGWPLDAQCADQAVFAGWHARLPRRVFDEVRRAAPKPDVSEPAEGGDLDDAAAGDAAAGKADPWRARQPLAMGATFSPFWHGVTRARTAADVFAVLRGMIKRGMSVPYELLVLSFERAVRVSNYDDVYGTIDELTAVIKQLGYPLHSAGIDLSIVELHARANGFKPEVVRALLAEYLSQYPLVNNNLGQLTRLAVVLLNAREPRAALTVADSGRAAETKVSVLNHDCASLQVVLEARMQLKLPLAPVLRELPASGIYFDRTFLRKVRQLLALAEVSEAEPTGVDAPSVLAELEDANSALVARARQDAADVHKIQN